MRNKIPTTYTGLQKNQMSAEQILYNAAEVGDITAVVAALVSGADINWKNAEKGRDSALHEVARYGYLEVASLLLSKGADPNLANTNGSTPLIVAVSYGHKDIAILLLDSGSNPKLVDKSGNNALLGAAYNDLREVVVLLLGKRVNPNLANKNGETPLFWAASFGHQEIVAILLDYSANPNLANKDGDTAIHEAAKEGHLKVAVLLLDNGADPNLINQDGSTPLIGAARSDHQDIVALLLEKEMDPNQGDKNGITALHFAAGNGHREVVSLLLNKGADPNQADKNGSTPLIRAVRFGHQDIAILLLDKGADSTLADKNGETAIHKAARNGYRKILALLSHNRADSNPANNDKKNLIAAYNGNQDISAIFLDRGTDHKLAQKEGDNAHRWAALNGHSEEATCMKSRSAEFDSFHLRDGDGLHSVEHIGFAHTYASSSTSSSSSSVENAHLILEKIRRKLEDYAGSGLQSAGRIKAVFAEIDVDNSGAINKDQFVRAMKVLRVDLTSREIQAVFDRFDRRSGESINYAHFLRLISFSSSTNAKWVQNIDPVKPSSSTNARWVHNIDPKPNYYESAPNQNYYASASASRVSYTSRNLPNLFDKLMALAKSGDLQKFVSSLSNSLAELRSYIHPQSGDTLLHALCHLGQIDAVTAALRKGVNVNILNEVFRILTVRPVWVTAIELGKEDMVEFLLLNKIDITLVDKFGKRASDYARELGQQKTLAFLEALSNQTPFDLNALHSFTGDSLLHVLCSNGRRDPAAELLAKGVPVDAPNTWGATALYHASMNGCGDTGSKVEVNYRDKSKYCPGRIKRDRGNGTYDVEYNDGEQDARVPADMIRVLDPVNGNLDVVALLLEQGADPDYRDKDGKKAVDVAGGIARVATVSLLNKWSAVRKLFDMNASGDQREFDSTLDSLCGASLFEIRFLQTQTKSRHIAASKQEVDRDRILARLEALSSVYQLQESVVSFDLQGFDATLAALPDASPALLQSIHPSSGESLLHVLCSRGHREAVVALVKKGVDVNSLNAGGSSCLEAAIGGGRFSVVEVLLQSGADISRALLRNIATLPEISRLLDRTLECLTAARDGHGSESSSVPSHLHKLEESLVAGAIPNATMDNQNALGYALRLHQIPEERRQENIAAVACLLGRNADLPFTPAKVEYDLLAQPWSPVMKALLEEAIQLKALDQVVLYRADLIVVGNGSSGKTTLLHRLKMDEFLTGATMTDGIDTTYLRIGQVYLTCSDAAGQPIYAHTISLFFKEDAIYLAVFNPRVENNVDSLANFLHMVQNSSPKARVVLATTRSDEVKMDDIMLEELRRRFPMICAVFPVDSDSGHGVDSLRQYLLQEALTRPSTRRVVSAALPRIIDRIVHYVKEHPDTFSVSREQLQFIMGESDLTREEQARLVDQLLSFGVIHKLSSSSSGLSGSNDSVFILRPQQLADVYACVVTKNPATLTRVKRLSKEGILVHSDDALRSVWGMYPEALWKCDNDSNCSARWLSLFLRLLHDSGLAFEVFDKFGRPQGRSVIPCLLPDKPAGFDGDISDDSELLRHFVPDYVGSTSFFLENLQVFFSSMPFTFFAQLLAGLRKMATDGGAWRNGAVLSAGVSYVLLREERSSITISLLGKNRSVRSVILLTMLQVMHKFSSMTIFDVVLTVGGRKWSRDDIKESLHCGHGVLYSAMTKAKVEVHSLWMLFPQEDKEDVAVTFSTDNDASSTIASSEQLALLQRTLQRAKAAKSMDFIVLVNRYLQNCVPILQQLMGMPRLLQGEDLPRPLWVILHHQVEEIFCVMPFFPHYVPDEPWMALEAAQIPLIPTAQTAETEVKRTAVLELLVDCFLTMRGSVADMLPSGWKLSLNQSLLQADPDLMAQREKEFFLCVDGTVYSKEFATKAQAMKTVSQRLLQNGTQNSPLRPTQDKTDHADSILVCESESIPDGIAVEAIRSFYDDHVEGKMKADCTTADILPLVKSLTKATPGDGSRGAGRSLCQVIKQKAAAFFAPSSSPSDLVGPATIFISHAWKYNFYEFLLALEARFKGKGVKLWIDNFCHNQHEELTSDAWVAIFENHIKLIGNTVMILFPWDNPIPFTRAWCLLEVFYSKKNNVNFEIYLTEEQRMQFLEFAQRYPGQAMLIFSRISTSQSTCWVLNDQLRIHSLIESSVGGFEAVDQLVRETIAKELFPHDSSFHCVGKNRNTVESTPTSLTLTITTDMMSREKESSPCSRVAKKD